MVVLSIVPEGAATHRVYNNEEEEEYDVDHGHFLPVGLDILQQPGLA